MATTIITLVFLSAKFFSPISALVPGDLLQFALREDVVTFILPGYIDIHQHCTGGGLTPSYFRWLYDCRRVCQERSDCIGISSFLPNGQWCMPKNSSCQLLPELATRWTFLKKETLDGYVTMATAKPTPPTTTIITTTILQTPSSVPSTVPTLVPTTSSATLTTTPPPTQSVTIPSERPPSAASRRPCNTTGYDEYYYMPDCDDQQPSPQTTEDNGDFADYYPDNPDLYDTENSNSTEEGDSYYYYDNNNGQT